MEKKSARYIHERFAPHSNTRAAPQPVVPQCLKLVSSLFFRTEDERRVATIRFENGLGATVRQESSWAYCVEALDATEQPGRITHNLPLEDVEAELQRIAAIACCEVGAPRTHNTRPKYCDHGRLQFVLFA